jgi:predicted DNA-binding transcriptional regulator YafY
LDIRIIIKIHELIEVELTGNPKDFAEKISVSERTIYNYLEFMKAELNAPIKYNNSKKSYYYNNECDLKFKL